MLDHRHGVYCRRESLRCADSTAEPSRGQSLYAESKGLPDKTGFPDYWWNGDFSPTPEKPLPRHPHPDGSQAGVRDAAVTLV